MAMSKLTSLRWRKSLDFIWIVGGLRALLKCEGVRLSIKPDASLIKPLKRMDIFSGMFVAVDCSTRTLKRANNWGIYLMRAAYAVVRERNVDWSYNERVCTVGDAHVRRSFLQNFRTEMKSQIALDLLTDETQKLYYIHEDARSMYLLLDGVGYFGGDRKFRVSLYERCEKNGVNLLAISKNSPSLHDEKGEGFHSYCVHYVSLRPLGLSSVEES
jgi:hypothetical protein